jgi:hypothetical protein
MLIWEQEPMIRGRAGMDLVLRRRFHLNISININNNNNNNRNNNKEVADLQEGMGRLRLSRDSREGMDSLTHSRRISNHHHNNNSDPLQLNHRLHKHLQVLTLSSNVLPALLNLVNNPNTINKHTPTLHPPPQQALHNIQIRPHHPTPPITLILPLQLN